MNEFDADYSHAVNLAMVKNITEQVAEDNPEHARDMVRELVETYGSDILDGMNPDLLRAAGYGE
jgi:uncharacterized protein YpuA (DUF1002 family)